MAKNSSKNYDATISKTQQELLKELYRQMLTMRRVEEAAAKAYSQGKMGGFLHLGIGQESSCVGSISSLEPQDYVITSYREHNHCIAKAGATKEICQAVLAELFGKETGISKGLGGSMHLFDAATRFLGGYGIVGGQTPLATGVAFASKYSGKKEVTLCFLGDGATPQGAFHEALTLASLWKLPIVFIIENNQYSMGTPLHRTSPISDLTKRASGYGMSQDRFTTEDVLEIRERIGKAIKQARDENLPTLIELITYRFRGHSISDPGNYRTKEEIEEWKKRDGVSLAREKLVTFYGEGVIQDLDNQIKEMVQEAVNFAETSAPANPSHLWDYIYATPGTNPKAM